MEIVQDPEKNGNLHMNENCNSEVRMFTPEKLVTKQSGNVDSKDNSNITNKENEIHNITHNRDQNDVYETETVSGNYTVSVALKNHVMSKSKKYNLIKIYRFITSEGINPDSI